MSRTEKITIQRETRIRRDGGGDESTWAQIGELWAKAEWIGGSEGEMRGAVRTVNRYRFTALSAGVESLAVTQKDRVVWNGEIYNIREMPRRLARRVETQIIAESGVTQ